MFKCNLVLIGPVIIDLFTMGMYVCVCVCVYIYYGKLRKPLTSLYARLHSRVAKSRCLRRYVGLCVGNKRNVT